MAGAPEVLLNEKKEVKRMGLFGDDKFMDDDDYLLSRVDPEEYDSIEEYELEHGTYGSPRRKKYDCFEDDDDEFDD